MRTERLRIWLESIWYGQRRVPWFLRALSLLFGALAKLRRAAYRKRWLNAYGLPVPVLVVGNIALGGAGKTPLVVALVEALRSRGWRPGVVSRGYGGNADRPTLVSDASDPAIVGDEPSLIQQRTRVPVAVGRDRVAAARLLVDAAVDVIVSDDGLQHYRLQRDVEIAVLDATRRLGNGRLLPAGPLREPAARLASVDFVVCNGEPHVDHEVPMRLVPARAIALSGAAAPRELREFAVGPVRAIAGIGHPGRFFASLEAIGLHILPLPFADHHAYLPEDLEFGDDLPVLMTEKDAVKCRGFARPNWWMVPVSAELPAAFLDSLIERLKTRTAHSL